MFGLAFSQAPFSTVGYAAYMASVAETSSGADLAQSAVSAAVQELLGISSSETGVVLAAATAIDSSSTVDYSSITVAIIPRTEELLSASTLESSGVAATASVAELGEATGTQSLKYSPFASTQETSSGLDTTITSVNSHAASIVVSLLGDTQEPALSAAATAHENAYVTVNNATTSAAATNNIESVSSNDVQSVEVTISAFSTESSAATDNSSQSSKVSTLLHEIITGVDNPGVVLSAPATAVEFVVSGATSSAVLGAFPHSLDISSVIASQSVAFSAPSFLVESANLIDSNETALVAAASSPEALLLQEEARLQAGLNSDINEQSSASTTLTVTGSAVAAVSEVALSTDTGTVYVSSDVAIGDSMRSFDEASVAVSSLSWVNEASGAQAGASTITFSHASSYDLISLQELGSAGLASTVMALEPTTTSSTATALFASRGTVSETATLLTTEGHLLVAPTTVQELSLGGDSSIASRAYYPIIIELSDADSYQSSEIVITREGMEYVDFDTSGSARLVAPLSLSDQLLLGNAQTSTFISTVTAIDILSAFDSSSIDILLSALSLKGVAQRPTIQPIDSFIKAGFAQQVSQQFRCPAIFVSSVDKLRNLQALLGNQVPTYPYIFLSVQSVSASQDGYMSNKLLRRGVPVSLNQDNNQVQTAQVVPANFEIEVTYITNTYSGSDTKSVEGYTRRWMFARRIGSMNFNVDYGLTQLSISYSITDSVPIPARENPADNESVYVLTSTITIHGFTSEPEPGSVGKINQIQITSGHPSDSGQFFPF